MFIDDTTNRLVELRFCDAESTFDDMHSAKRRIARYGKPVAFHSDKHSGFRANKKDAAGGSGLTRFGRALHDLNIDIIYADSSHAKGRVERMNLTLPDRLVKQLRLEGIDTIAAAKDFMPQYIENLNERFGRESANPTGLHRPLTEHDDLEEALCWQEDRTVFDRLSVQYDRVLYLLEPGDLTNGLRRKRVTVFGVPAGTIAIKHEGVPLPYSAFDRVGNVKQADIVSNRRLGAALAFAKEQQEKVGLARSKKAPGRRGQGRIREDTKRQSNPALH